jgi:predicted transcriptional regulator
MMLGIEAFRAIKPTISMPVKTTPYEKVNKAIKPKEQITANEIMKDTNLLSGSVYRELARLEVDGIITKSHKGTGITGNPVYYSRTS